MTTMSKKGIFAILLLLALHGCMRNKIRLWTDFTTVYYAYSDKTEPIRIRPGHPFVAHSFSLEGIAFTMADTPKGKIDSIIAANPYWDFVFYCNCSIKDTAKLGTILRDCNCHFPVVLDTANHFMTMNRDRAYGAIGFICDSEKNIMGLGIIGGNRSTFDEVFIEVKKRLGYPIN